MYLKVDEWKSDHMDEVINGQMPKWVCDPPQIDIESGGQWINVKRNRDKLHNKCFKAKGIFGKWWYIALI